MPKIKEDISIFFQARKASRRCQNKMLRPFANSCLIDICLEKLNQLTSYPVYFGIAESEFLAKAYQYPNIQVIQRSEESSGSDSDPKKIFQALISIPTPYVCWINPCHPLLQKETIENAIDYFLDSSAKSLTSVITKTGWFYDINGEPLTNRSIQADTSMSDGIYQVAHAFHIYRKEQMLATGRPWENKNHDPLLFEIPLLEASDIDNEEEFIMVEALYQSFKKGPKEAV